MSKSTHINGVTGKTIKAENLPALDHAMRAQRFAEPRWATFWQWKGTGRTVPKGASGVELVGKSGFKWSVFNISQTSEVGAEAARAPAPVSTPAPAAPARKTNPTRAGLKKAPHERRAAGAPADTREAFAARLHRSVDAAAAAKVMGAFARQLYVDGSQRPVVVVDNAQPKRTPRPRIRQQPGKHGGMSVGEIDPLQARPATPETVASIVRLNRLLNLGEDEALSLIKAFPGRTYFDPDEVARAHPTAHRIAEAKRWRALWERKATTSQKLGALKTWAWLVFTGRKAEASAYIKRANARRPGQDCHEKPDTTK